MGFARINYNGEEEIFETTVSDGTGKVIERWKCMKRDYVKVLRILNKKFSLGINIKDVKDRDLDWALRI